jgi:hypothetical protein
MQLGRKNERTESGNNIPQRGTDGFTAVEFPIRIGEYQQLSDGVIGYWKEKEKPKGDYEYEGYIFYAQQSDEVESEYIETQYCEPNINKDIGEGPINIIQTLDSPPQKLTLLIDPHHALHITAGILPTKVVTIPPEQYVPVLEAIEVPFLTSPILTHRDSYNLPLPKVPQYAWSWLEKKVQQWHEIYEFSTIDKAILLQEFPKQFPKVAPEAVWQLLIDAGWLKVMPNDPTKAAIVPQENRPKDDQGGQVKPLSGNLKTQGKEINQFLERHQMSLTSASSQASFAESLQIREGWLVLKKVNSPLAPHHPQTESLGLHKQSLPPQAQEL